MSAANERPELPLFRAPYRPSDEALAAAFLADDRDDAATARRIDVQARRLIEAFARAPAASAASRISFMPIAVDPRRAGADGDDEDSMASD